MSQYNWANLSDHDFELVCRDVLSAVLKGKTVEAFARGADGGVDLRYISGRTFVLGQAKHYLRSGYSKLLTQVAKEKLKIDGMSRKPTRYILFTSEALTPARKSELKKALGTYCKSPSDIFGVEDIEGVIQSNPSIEEHHYKLWLSSVRVLERILGSASWTRSEIRVSELTQRARLFVPHSAMKDAEAILKNEKSLIISGAPGIGKTTLAEMISLRFLASGYRVNFASSVSDIEREIGREEKQLHVFDDFLGRTNLTEAPPHSEQERLFTIMRHIRTKPNKYLIMTTREYLYREARAANERIKQERTDVIRCLLDVPGYARENRAQILYNHLYWTPGLSSADLADFVKKRGYRPIIDHDEFNPRFIADTINRIAPRRAIHDEDDKLWT